VRFQPAAVQMFASAIEFAFAGQTLSRHVTGTGVGMFTLTVFRQGPGSVTIATNPPGILCGGQCSESYPAGTEITLTAIVSPGSSLDGDVAVDLTCTVTLTANRSVTAQTSGLATLAVAKAGTGRGLVVSGEPGIDCGATCLAPFGAATSVTLTATPGPGSGRLEYLSGTDTCTVIMSAPRLVTATFMRRPDLALTALAAPATGQTGRPLAVTTTVRNLAAVAATAFRVTFFMSPDDPTPASFDAGSYHVSAIGHRHRPREGQVAPAPSPSRSRKPTARRQSRRGPRAA
jgi:hypothetical protein